MNENQECMENYETISEEIKYITNSLVRLKILATLYEQPLNMKDINRTTGLSYSSISSNMFGLELGGFLVEDGVPIDHPRGDEHPAHTGPGRRACDLHVLGDGHGTQGERQGARRRAVRRAGHHPVPAAVRQRERHIQVLYQVGICCWGMYRT